MKKTIIFLTAIFTGLLCFAQGNERTAFPKLDFDTPSQKELYSKISADYNSSDRLPLDEEMYSAYWEGRQIDKMAATATIYLLRNLRKDKMKIYSDKDAATVGKAIIDWCMARMNKKVPLSYPFSIKAYQEYLKEVLHPVKDVMCSGSQYELNTFAAMDDNLHLFGEILKNQMIISKFKSSGLKVALQAEEEAWSDFREEFSDLFYNYRIKINDGIYYTLLPLELSEAFSVAANARDTSLSVLYAISKEHVGAVVSPMDDKDYSADLQTFFNDMQEDGLELSDFKLKWETFLSKREEVGKLLPPNLRKLYSLDTNRYIKLVAGMHRIATGY